MTVKKILLLASTALGAIAFAAPAPAQAEPTWYDDTNQFAPTIFNPKALELHGNLVFTLPFGIKIGPCELNLTETLLYNNGETGEGAIGNGQLEPCPTSLPGCEVEKGELMGLPWNIKLTGGFKLEITGIETLEIELTFSKGCKTYGFPAMGKVTGTATGTFNNEINEIEFTEAGDLKLGEIAIGLDGTIGSGTSLTVK